MENKQPEHWLSENIQAILSLIVFIGGLVFLKYAKAPDTVNARIEDMMFLVLTFFFGSSKSGAKKDETIASLSQGQQPSIQQTGDNPIATTNPQPDDTPQK